MLSAFTLLSDLDHICHVDPCQHSASYIQMYICVPHLAVLQFCLCYPPRQVVMPSFWSLPPAFPQMPEEMTARHHPCGMCCSYSGGSYQQHLGMLEQWIDGSGRAQATPTSSDGRRRKGAKGAGQSACSKHPITPCHQASCYANTQDLNSIVAAQMPTVVKQQPHWHLECIWFKAVLPLLPILLLPLDMLLVFLFDDSDCVHPSKSCPLLPHILLPQATN